MRRKKTPNIDFIVGMAEEFVNGGDYWNFMLDFMYYFIEKYDKHYIHNYYSLISTLLKPHLSWG
ncbi:MAG: hypothetical protein BGN88_13265 [Clostridiales bacterium 43-6]|nr:MAG: hypothetical protein BGN88_13265 [Clostridiales bacterium 43-6]